jgi:hypothetical protein
VLSNLAFKITVALDTAVFEITYATFNKRDAGSYGPDRKITKRKQTQTIVVNMVGELLAPWTFSISFIESSICISISSGTSEILKIYWS